MKDVLDDQFTPHNSGGEDRTKRIKLVVFLSALILVGNIVYLRLISVLIIEWKDCLTYAPVLTLAFILIGVILYFIEYLFVYVFKIKRTHLVLLNVVSRSCMYAFALWLLFFIIVMSDYFLD